jgi:hypothetical protein
VVVGNPGTRRTRGFWAALTGLNLPEPVWVPYANLLAGRSHLADVVTPGAIVRIESPDEAPDVQRSILERGAGPAEAENGEFIPPSALATALADKGRLLPSRQWYLGFRTVLREIELQLEECPPHRLMNAPEDVAVMFDKPRCHALLRDAAVSVPKALQTTGVDNMDALLAAMRLAGMLRVFVKPAHGSSASGVVAFQAGVRELLATTTVEVVRDGTAPGGVRLYNSKCVRTYRGAEVRPLLDALCRQPLHVEQWLPKAGIEGQTFDLRVVVIGGRAQHTVARLSRTPITNLHLDNERRSTDGVRARMGETAWRDAMATCERAMALFPRSLYAGIDLLIGASFRSHAILEVNAFGDLLLNTYCDGQDCYTAEVRAVLDQLSAGCVAPRQPVQEPVAC